MKLINLTFSSDMESAVANTLKENGIECFLKVPKLLGRAGVECAPLLDDHVWPGFMVMYRILVEDDDYQTVKPVLSGLADRYRDRGFRATVLDVAESL
jgi:hypothetical protein